MSLRRLAILPALGLALATVNVACQKKSEPPKDDMTPTQRPMGVPAGGERPSMEQVSMVQPVTIREQAQGQNLELNDPLPTVYLFTNRTQLEAAGGDELLDEMKVNFKRHSLVLAYLGEQTSGGYWARIDRVYSVGDVLHADVTVNRPGDDQMSTMALTHPYAAAVIDKADASTVTPHWKQVAGQAMEGSGGGMQEEGMDEVKGGGGDAADAADGDAAARAAGGPGGGSPAGSGGPGGGGGGCAG